MTSPFLIGTRKGIFAIERGSRGWFVARTHFLATPAPQVVIDHRDGSYYAGLEHGHFGNKLHRSDDAGASWQEISTPQYPPKPEGTVDLDPMRQKPIPWNLEKLWQLTPGGHTEPGRLWAGTIPGGLFRSDDRGESWALITSLWHGEHRKAWLGGGYDWPGIHSICVDPRDSRHITVAVSCGGVWRSTDDGATWTISATGMRAAYMPPERANDENIQDPHRMVQCHGHPDRFWVQHHNGIFTSTDSARTWREIEGVEPSTFGFGCVVHPSDPMTAWFVPAHSDEQRIPVDARVVVTRTRDGGESFQVLTDGLPQEHAYDLTFRHALAISHDGQVLAFGTTSGSVWISEDHGDSWEQLSAHLPPVYCIAF